MKDLNEMITHVSREFHELCMERDRCIDTRLTAQTQFMNLTTDQGLVLNDPQKISTWLQLVNQCQARLNYLNPLIEKKLNQLQIYEEMKEKEHAD